MTNFYKTEHKWDDTIREFEAEMEKEFVTADSAIGLDGAAEELCSPKSRVAPVVTLVPTYRALVQAEIGDRDDEWPVASDENVIVEVHFSSHFNGDDDEIAWPSPFHPNEDDIPF